MRILTVLFVLSLENIKTILKMGLCCTMDIRLHNSYTQLMSESAVLYILIRVVSHTVFGGDATAFLCAVF